MTTHRARLWVVRHGQISANVSGHWHGSTDTPLNALGERQADAVGAWFQGGEPALKAVYCSPLVRTFATASAIARPLGMTPEPVDGLREYGIGTLEGESFRALFGELGFIERMSREAHWAPELGESRAAVLARMRAAFEAIAARHRGEDVAVVGHGAATGLLLAELLRGDALAWGDFHVDNCSVTELHLGADGAGLQRFNDTTHLAGLSEPAAR